MVQIIGSIAVFIGLLNLCAGVENGSCPAVSDNRPHSHTKMLLGLVEDCKYDRFTRPGSQDVPLNIKTRLYVYFLGSIEAQSLRFTAHILVRFRWTDPRLKYKDLHPNVPRVVGESVLRDSIWTPHVYLVNEQDSTLMGAGQKDVLVTVYPDGTVLFSTRMKVTLFCLMKLQKFPFDEQECPLTLESWSYNMTELQLVWEESQAVIVNEHLHLTEYSLMKTWTSSSYAQYSDPSDPEIVPLEAEMFSYGKFAGHYSSLTVKFQLAREVGFYIMDFYVPSILLVVVSWVSFWLDPNAVPGRTTLGTSTMLTFITLTRNTGGSLPKVSYIKATEIWFIVCTGFIFGSLVEFAFVNTIWRRKQNVELKKVNSKYILKSTLTPQTSRKQYQNNLDRCQSWPSVVDDKKQENMFYLNSSTNELTVQSTDSIARNPSSNTLSVADNNDCESVTIPVPNSNNANKGFTTMTPQEIADWIDRRSRILFPVAFLLFNFLYWGFVWI